MIQPTPTPVSQDVQQISSATGSSIEEPKKTTPGDKTLEFEAEAESLSGAIHLEVRPHAFVIMPFDVFNVRTIPYHITPEGVPDPAFLEKDKVAISRLTRDTWGSDVDSIHRPIFNLLRGLVEPDRKTLRTPLATGFWREYNEWKDRLTIGSNLSAVAKSIEVTPVEEKLSSHGKR